MTFWKSLKPGEKCVLGGAMALALLATVGVVVIAAVWGIPPTRSLLPPAQPLHRGYAPNNKLLPDNSEFAFETYGEGLFEDVALMEGTAFAKVVCGDVHYYFSHSSEAEKPNIITTEKCPELMADGAYVQLVWTNLRMNYGLCGTAHWVPEFFHIYSSATGPDSLYAKAKSGSDGKLILFPAERFISSDQLCD